MRIAVRDIPSYPVSIDGVISQDEFDFSDDAVSCIIQPVEVFAKLEKITNAVTVAAEVKAKFSFVCTRCLESFEKEIQKDFKFNYMIEPTTNHIELGDDIRQEIITEIPMKILCRDDCKGICQSCGINLNEEKCKCNK
ncbi:MAG: DUF177 domain-containing protein [Candidatus Aceula meridiana]|nr:DUF177 domain-containing protein [Candidatus Aceula meridiana]